MFILEKKRDKDEKSRGCVFKYVKAVRCVVEVLYGPNELHKVLYGPECQIVEF